jgi:hypothetical protein
MTLRRAAIAVEHHRHDLGRTDMVGGIARPGRRASLGCRAVVSADRVWETSVTGH